MSFYLAWLYSKNLFVRLSLEHMSGERDKLRADIMDANERASLLAQEVDDHHARLEKSSQLQVK
jgi:ninein